MPPILVSELIFNSHTDFSLVSLERWPRVAGKPSTSSLSIVLRGASRPSGSFTPEFMLRAILFTSLCENVGLVEVRNGEIGYKHCLYASVKSSKTGVDIGPFILQFGAYGI